MFDRQLAREILIQIENAVLTVRKRCETVRSARFFTDSPEGMEKLDAACMLLMAIGESVKQLDKLTNGELLKCYPSIDWIGIKGFRDIAAHHYFDIDAEQVFWIISRELQPLSATITQMLYDLQ